MIEFAWKFFIGVAVVTLALGANILAQRVETLEKSFVPPADLRTAPCVPLSYLLSNRPRPKIHSYSKPLTICEEQND